DRSSFIDANAGIEAVRRPGACIGACEIAEDVRRADRRVAICQPCLAGCIRPQQAAAAEDCGVGTGPQVKLVRRHLKVSCCWRWCESEAGYGMGRNVARCE